MIGSFTQMVGAGARRCGFSKRRLRSRMVTCSVQCGKPAVADFYSDAVIYDEIYVLGPYPICQQHIDILSRGRYPTQLAYHDGRVVKIREPGVPAEDRR